MIYNHQRSILHNDFRLNCVGRVLSIVATVVLVVILWLQTRYFATTCIVALLLLLQIMNLLNYVDETNRLLSRAFESVLYDDLPEKVTTPFHDSTFKELGYGLNRIVDEFRKNHREREEQYHYLQAVIRQSSIGLISVKQNGDVNLINKSAGHMLGRHHLGNMRQLKRFGELLMQMRNGERRHFDMENEFDSARLTVSLKIIHLKGQAFRLFTLQNIQSELEEKEMDAWRNLIRVLSHEIMNSMTPISSLAATANLLIGNGESIPSSNVEDLKQAMQTIEKRSRGLMEFVQNYRQFARISEPNRQIITVAGLFGRIEQLVVPGLTGERSIDLTIRVTPDNLQLNIDPALIEQVLLNLIRNAVDAVKERSDPKIELRASVNEKSIPIIQIEDNGRGIPEEVQARIFIPFFTTRPEGSGIGLSLSRQIMHMHNGGIRVKSEPKERTVFSLIFSDQGEVRTSIDARKW